MIIATNNKGKIADFKEIFGNNIYSLRDKNINIDVVEDGRNFKENAIKKAKAIFDICHEPVISDDSGLCITGLDNFPGVMTHRFLGDNATDRERNLFLIEQAKKLNNREAKFVCNVVYYDGEVTIVSEGTLTGTISLQPKGENGFGFDEIFLLSNGKTLAELSSEEKNKISPRKMAIVDLLNKLNKIKNIKKR